MLIYLDMCLFNRPFDDQDQLLVRLQTEAKLYVHQLDGMKALVNALGPVEAERFITPPNSEKLDYTEWCQQQWLDGTVASLTEKARALRQAKNGYDRTGMPLPQAKVRLHNGLPDRRYKP